MKIKIEFDLTPEEFRSSLGLPDIAGLQDEALELLKSQMSSTIKDVDVVNVIETLLGQGIAASRKVQELVMSAATSILDDDDSAREPAKAKGKASKK